MEEVSPAPNDKNMKRLKNPKIFDIVTPQTPNKNDFSNSNE